MSHHDCSGDQPWASRGNFSPYRKTPNVGAGTCGIWGHSEEAQKPLHETMRLAEARLERHAPGGSMPSEAPKHYKIQSRRDAPKMAILEAQCAQNAPGRSTMRPPEALLPQNPTCPSHLRPVILKPVGRIFEISDSNTMQRKCGICGRPCHARKTRV